MPDHPTVPERPSCDGSRRCGYHHAVVGVGRCCCGLPWINKACASGAQAGEPAPDPTVTAPGDLRDRIAAALREKWSALPDWELQWAARVVLAVLAEVPGDLRTRMTDALLRARWGSETPPASQRMEAARDADAVLAVLAADPGDLRKRMAAAIRDAECPHAAFPCPYCRADAALGVRCEEHARAHARLAIAERRAEVFEDERDVARERLKEARDKADQLKAELESVWDQLHADQHSAMAERERAEKAEAERDTLVQQRDHAAALIRAQKQPCPEHQSPLPRPSCWHCARTGALERAARIVLGEFLAVEEADG